MKSVADRPINDTMNYDYSGTTPVVIGDKVTLIDEDGAKTEGRVVVTLSSQFIARTQTMGDFFKLYKDKGVTWIRN